MFSKEVSFKTFPKAVTSERIQRNKETNHAKNRGRSSKCKGPELGIHLGGPRQRKEASVTRV